MTLTDCNVSVVTWKIYQFSKETFYLRLSAKLSYQSASAQTYWSILKIFVNGNKVPSIPPVTGKLVINFIEKLIFLMISLVNNASQYQTTAFFRLYLLSTQVTD